MFPVASGCVNELASPELGVQPLSDASASALASGSNTLGSEWSSSCWSSSGTWQSDLHNNNNPDDELFALGFGPAVVSPVQGEGLQFLPGHKGEGDLEDEDEEDGGEGGMEDDDCLGMLFPPPHPANHNNNHQGKEEGKAGVKEEEGKEGERGGRHVRGRSMYEAKMKALAKVGRQSGSHVHPLTNALSAAEQAQGRSAANPKQSQPQPQPQPPGQGEKAGGKVTCALDLAVVLQLLAASSNGDEVARVMRQLQGKAQQDAVPNAAQREAQRRLSALTGQHQRQQQERGEEGRQSARQCSLRPPPQSPNNSANSVGSVHSDEMAASPGRLQVPARGQGLMGRPPSRAAVSRASSAGALSPPASTPHPRRASHGSPDAKLLQRKERNREIARQSRARKKMYMQALEGRLRQMEEAHASTMRHIHSLASENAMLKQTTVALEKQVEALSLENGSLRSASSSGGGGGGVSGAGAWGDNDMEDVLNVGDL